ncbi:hypothetical protein DL766_003843 [Monosporascus sp. MC13-8B]|uniref:Uncharacterized protein n=1 Tax=Monosporascus cannonballus TaxID=155416 RepID=A0ABY0GXR0_9PEZI|nr:hypothetical protein DL762_007923 [Monosporascus cannonballus]RYO90612.1 hypothetical protein DL763_005287 [Monosporascus cannonballus]RYP32755.1 hypothetical protein DL766_003843 [Monosporascus sp. MC13-8B]
MLRTETRELRGRDEGDMLFEGEMPEQKASQEGTPGRICMMCETVEGGSKRKRRDVEYWKAGEGKARNCANTHGK